MSFPRYKKYKPSGVEWLGDVPEHWEVKRLKHLVANENYAGIQTGPFGGMLTDVLYQEDGEFKVYGQENVLSGDFEKGIRWVGAERFEALSNYHANSGDLLFTRKGSIGGCCSFPATAHPGIIDSDTIRVSLNQEVISQTFLLLAFKFSQYQEVQIQMLKRGAILSGLNTEVLANLVILTPPLSEQTQIAAFLDREMAKIDELVAEQRRLMELLKEKRQAVISHAVTQGLNPKAPMKPSGIEWLGDVPEHWEVLKLKFLCDVQTGSKDTENAVEDGLYPFFVRSQTVERINSMAFDCEAILTAGDGVGVGKVFHYHNGPFDFHQRVYMMSNFRKVSGPFLFHYFRENFYKVALEGGAKSTVDSLRRPVFMNFIVSVPPIEEQQAIVEVVERESEKFDTLTAEAQRAIDLLQERRTALISAAVTGQIDVRKVPAR